MFFFSPLFGYYKAINPTAWPMNLFLRHDTTRSFILSWRHYVITANTIKKKNAYLFIRFERVCTCLRVFTNFEREKNNRTEETNERYDWKRIRRMWYFFFFIYIYIQSKKKIKKMSLPFFPSSLLSSSKKRTIVHTIRILTVFPVIRSTLQVGAQHCYK